MNNKRVTPMVGHDALKEDVTKRSKLRKRNGNNKVL
jgi:hypothetical protein